MSNTKPPGYQTITISYRSHTSLIFLKSLITYSAMKCLIKEEHNRANHMRHVTGTRNAITMATHAFPSQSTLVSPSVHSAEIFHYYNLTQPTSLKYESTSRISISYYNGKIKYSCIEMLGNVRKFYSPKSKP